jgi:hypothetical protein
VKKEITTELVRELLNYDQDTGVFTWRSRDRVWFKREKDFKRFHSLYAGAVAGTVKKKATGYPQVQLKVLGKDYLAHRLAFIYMGEALPEQVDHLNRDSLDNRWKNLTASSQEQNMKNMSMKLNNTSGVTSVYWHKPSGKWLAQSQVAGRRKHLGLFTDLAEASEVVKAFRLANGYSEGHGEQLAEYVDKSIDSAIQNG